MGPRSFGQMRKTASSNLVLSKALLVFYLLFASFSAKPSQSAEGQKVGFRNDSSSPRTSPFKVGVVLHRGSAQAKMSRLCMEIALSDFYLAYTNYTTRLDFQFRESEPGPVAAASAAGDLMLNERVQAIVGPETSDEAAFVSLLGNKSKVPVISFSATSPSVSPVKTPFFIRTAVNDSSQANAIASLISYFGWRQVVPIYEESEFGTGMMPYVVDAIKAVGAQVPYRIVIPPSASDDYISKELQKLINMECRVFLVQLRLSLASTFFSKAKEAEMMSEGFVWIISEGLTSVLGMVDTSVLRQDFSGVVGLKVHVNESEKLQHFKNRWVKESRLENPDSNLSDLTVFGLWAYDTVWALALAAETVGAADPGYSKPQSLRNLSYLNPIGVSTTGQRLREAMLSSEFIGMSGHFHLAGGQLDGPEFEIVNVVGNSLHTIGYWTDNGLRRQLDGGSSKPQASPLLPVIWPGDTTVVPKGWVTPIIGKKLRILVPGPVDPGFHSFLKADINAATGQVEAGGFVIEVFESALKELPYAVSVEYFQIQREPGKPKPTYDELVHLVFEQKYDGLVGDVTITANRSNYGDFTLPYTTSGVRMVVPLRDDRKMSTWTFIKPLSGNLWIVSGAFFVYTGLVVWIMEHRYNDKFRGSLTNQIGTASYFIASTLVFSHKEKMMTNFSRFVVVIWVFVVLVLQSSYTASLTSMLTVKRLRPTSTDFSELILKGEYVGYLRSSFTKNLLLKEGFKAEKLRPYKSPQEYLDGLVKGSKMGGVGAIIDEIPYLRFFLKDYCSNYTMAGSPYKAGGFGFVFPKGSPLAPDISTAILKLGEGDKMLEIEKRWFGDLSNCPTDENSLTSHSLNFSNFWGLFLTTGLASLVALLGSLMFFLYHERNALRGTDSGQTLNQKFMMLWKRFIEKDKKAYKSKKKSNDRDGLEMETSQPSACACGRSSRDSSYSPFTGRSELEMGSPYTSGFSTPLIKLDDTEGRTTSTNLASLRGRSQVESVHDQIRIF